MQSYSSWFWQETQIYLLTHLLLVISCVLFDGFYGIVNIWGNGSNDIKTGFIQRNIFLFFIWLIQCKILISFSIAIYHLHSSRLTSISSRHKLIETLMKTNKRWWLTNLDNKRYQNDQRTSVDENDQQTLSKCSTYNTNAASWWFFHICLFIFHASEKTISLF